MATKTQPNYLGDILKWEEPNLYSREEATILSGQNLKVGTVIGKVTVGAVTGAAAAGNTGNGTIGSLSAGTGARPGVYKVACIEPAANGGTFAVFDPEGLLIGSAVVGSAFAGVVNFTISDGATDFIAGDRFDITVADGTKKVKASPNTASDGSDAAAGILASDVDASAGDVRGVIIVRQALVSVHGLVYDASVDDATKKAAKQSQLARLGILVRSGA